MRKMTAIVLSLILAISLTLPVSAATAGTFLLSEYDVSADALYCYGKQLPVGGALTISAGAQKVENALFSTLKQERVPVTVYCLVDISSSLPDSVMQQQRDILLTLSSLMERQDNMVLGFLDKSLTESKPLSDKDTRDTAINTIQRQNWYTNLYQGISQAMDAVCTNTAYHTNRCLVILSDGHDDGKTTVTADQVLEKIKASGIPVYSIMLASSSSGVIQKDLHYQEQFCMESLGGFLCQPLAEGVSAATAAERVWDNIKNGTAIRIDLKELQNVESDQELLIRYETGDTRYEDTILIRAVDLVVPTTETSAVTEEETNEDDNAESDDKVPLELWLVAGIVILLLAAGTVVFTLLKKKNVSPEVTIPVREVPNYNDLDTDIEPVSLEEAPQTAPISGGCHIYAVALMHPEVTADFWVSPKVETTFGRSAQADVQLCGTDKKLSGIHGSLLWDGKMLFVRDKNSKNGTAVNGEACFGETWLRLEDGATLRAGAYEYRISFRMNEENEW